MDEKLRTTVDALANWEELRQLEANAKASLRFTEELAAALRNRSTELAIRHVEQSAELSLAELKPSERKIVRAVGEYVGLMQVQGKYPSRTMGQLRNRKLIGAAEVAVAKSRPTRGYEALAEANIEDLSYEQIVIEHPEDFSRRALWFSRKTLGLANRWPEAPPTPRAKLNGRPNGWSLGSPIARPRAPASSRHGPTRTPPRRLILPSRRSRGALPATFSRASTSHASRWGCHLWD